MLLVLNQSTSMYCLKPPRYLAAPWIPFQRIIIENSIIAMV